ncbi:hypothetical protein NY2A_b114L [Paramecium bursaria Chlorella virus NY2A]|uniref:Uncharacterized protein b114L n=1 Tax=Paramecium bursaria Chlorella virus NY2A TaxID=46021 RepID=A7IVY9_PBCVN|nr:hypothetical protein NY2A_b114L [Paramecium bursaria Chlorella virus NY2A]ABT14513.1 hypothetical protein NY2A_b114L [Paramecium bursaria Chlorella virus NY2A]
MKLVLAHRPMSVVQRQRRNVIVRNDIVESSRILGHCLTAGVMFYTTLQWAHFRRLRIEKERKNDK